MTAKAIPALRCAIYTRKSTEHGIELEFNSLHAQREACEAYIKSQAHEGWQALRQPYDDPAYSGASMKSRRTFYRKFQFRSFHTAKTRFYYSP